MQHFPPTSTQSQVYARGFTMFLAVLVSSLALAIGLAIYDLVIRELQLSSTSEQSQYAFYAADTAVECTLYWDFKYNGTESIFATSSTDKAMLVVGNASCEGSDIAATMHGTPGNISADDTSVAPFVKKMSTTTLAIGPYYAVVNVLKVTNTLTGVLRTTIFAHGYNTQSINSPNAVEREIQVDY